MAADHSPVCNRTSNRLHGIGIAGRGMGLVAAFLAAEVDLLIPSATRRRFDFTGAFFGLRLFMLGFHQRAVYREV
ncbi:MAG: hypothetical protein JWP25_6997 [Bradyrhizobium sp.]|jgi:hypothetical protein|nr:hypothetical protein [Bradyrhizobium sp.]MEA2865391.1 hypothetical protein [Bradyrhizobium sp.]